MFERLACVGLFCLFALPSFAKGPVASAGVTNEGAAANWLTHGGDTDETHYSRLKMIDTSNIGRLGLQWFLDLPGEASLAGTPLAVDGVLYFTSILEGMFGTIRSIHVMAGITTRPSR